VATVLSLDDARDVHDAIRDRLAAADRELLGNYPIAAYVAQFDEAARDFGYRHVPPSARKWVREIEAQAGAAALEDYHRLVLATLVLNRDRRDPPVQVPPSVSELVGRWLVRVLGQLEVPDGYFRHENDLFAKDFAICRLRLLPCGSEHVDVMAGVARSTLLKGGAGQLWRGLRFFGARRQGFQSWLEGHWDRRLIREFTPEKYDRFYERVAELLEANPHLKGLAGATWWFDPALESLSPELVHLRRVPEENGAALFRIGADERATLDATFFSKERKAALDAGRYQPIVYLLAWGREDMIRWARARAN